MHVINGNLYLSYMFRHAVTVLCVGDMGERGGGQMYCVNGPNLYNHPYKRTLTLEENETNQSMISVHFSIISDHSRGSDTSGISACIVFFTVVGILRNLSIGSLRNQICIHSCIPKHCDE